MGKRIFPRITTDNIELFFNLDGDSGTLSINSDINNKILDLSISGFKINTQKRINTILPIIMKISTYNKTITITAKKKWELPGPNSTFFTGFEVYFQDYVNYKNWQKFVQALDSLIKKNKLLNS